MESGDGDVDEGFEVPVSVAVVEAIAAAEGVSADQICPPAYPPLYVAIDPQALDALFERDRIRTRTGQIEVTFEYAGYQVTVDQDGRVSAVPVESE